MQNESLLLFHFRVPCNFSEAKITQKREKCKMKACFYFHFRVPCNFSEAKLRKNERNQRDEIQHRASCCLRDGFEMRSR